MKTFTAFTMDHHYIDDMFYFPFKGLRNVGQWTFETENVFKGILYLLYRVFIFVYGWQIVMFGLIDFYLNRHDARRVIFNSCTTVFTLGVTIKNIYIMEKSERIENLRIRLFQDSQVQKDEEDVEILDRYQKVLKTIATAFLTIFIMFYPFWMASSLMSLKWGPRELPFPVWLPLDLEDDLQFGFGFIYHALSGCFIVLEAAYADLGLYSLLLQTTGQYVILKKDVLKVNELYSVEKKKEINKYLLRLILRKKFKMFLKRQLELKEYVLELERSYNQVMLVQLIGGMMVAIGNGLELIMVMSSFSIKILYQFAFFFIIISDLFICCVLMDSLVDECKSINTALYNLAWYEMENDNMKDILLMTIGTQKTPSLTAGKLFPLNLETYLGFMKNLYSWLALFRQIVMIK